MCITHVKIDMNLYVRMCVLYKNVNNLLPVSPQIFDFIWLLQSHVVAAFEQSLTNMTTRLQTLTHTAEQKVKSQ